MRNYLTLALLAALLAIAWTGAPALAQTGGSPSDTLQAVLRNGVILISQGRSIPITYQEDGTYSGEVSGVVFSGSWRIRDNTRMCTSSSLSPLETCTGYPEGMGPGDTFEVTSATLGRVRITIRENETDR